MHRQRLLPLLRLLRDEYLWHNHVHVHIFVRDTARSCRSSTGGDSHLEEVGLGWVISWAGSAPSAKEGVYGADGKDMSVVVSGDGVWPDAVHEKRRLTNYTHRLHPLESVYFGPLLGTFDSVFIVFISQRLKGRGVPSTTLLSGEPLFLLLIQVVLWEQHEVGSVGTGEA